VLTYGNSNINGRFAIPYISASQIQKLISTRTGQKPGQEKNYKMCESRAEIKQDDIEVF
jgi:hypothetical protein